VDKRNEYQSLKNIGVFNNILSTLSELKKFVGKRKTLSISVSAPSVPAEQLSMSVLAEKLSAIEFGVKKPHVV